MRKRHSKRWTVTVSCDALESLFSALGKIKDDPKAVVKVKSPCGKRMTTDYGSLQYCDDLIYAERELQCSACRNK